MPLQNIAPLNDQLADIIVRADTPWIESKPGDPLAEELIKDLILKPDLDEAISQVHGLIRDNRHLDFLLFFRDYCKLADDAVRNPMGNLEWQNLESRFRRLIDKWPSDVRLYGFTSHMASMRTDFVTARELTDQGQRVIENMPSDRYRGVLNDLKQRSILFSHSIGMARLKENDPRQALEELNRSLSDIRKLRESSKTDIKTLDPNGTLDYIEILNGLGLADALNDLGEFDKAIAQYTEVAKLIGKYAASPTVANERAKLEEEIEIRQGQLRSIDARSGLLQIPKHN